jgi:hypothetical protein
MSNLSHAPKIRISLKSGEYSFGDTRKQSPCKVFLFLGIRTPTRKFDVCESVLSVTVRCFVSRNVATMRG